MWYKSHSAVKPSLVDVTSSSKFNYVRKNIVLEKSKEEDTPDMYAYDEAKFAKNDTSIIGYMAEIIEIQGELNDSIQADILLNQMDMLNNQSEQDGTLALILENIL